MSHPRNMPIAAAPMETKVDFSGDDQFSAPTPPDVLPMLADRGADAGEYRRPMARQLRPRLV